MLEEKLLLLYFSVDASNMIPMSLIESEKKIAYTIALRLRPHSKELTEIMSET